jgi:hypothetical protein
VSQIVWSSQVSKTCGGHLQNSLHLKTCTPPSPSHSSYISSSFILSYTSSKPPSWQEIMRLHYTQHACWKLPLMIHFRVAHEGAGHEKNFGQPLCFSLSSSTSLASHLTQSINGQPPTLANQKRRQPPLSLYKLALAGHLLPFASFLLTLHSLTLSSCPPPRNGAAPCSHGRPWP